jgi:hypothetical protein
MPDPGAAAELTARARRRAAEIDPGLDVRLESAYLRAARARLEPDAVERLRAALEDLTDAARALETAGTHPVTRGARMLRRTASRVTRGAVSGPASRHRHDEAVRTALEAVLATFDQTLASIATDVLADLDALQERVVLLEHRLRDANHPID